MSELVLVGLDVAQGTVDMSVRPSGDRWVVSNDEAGIAGLVARLQPLRPTLIVGEATGGFERGAIAGLAAAGLPVVAAKSPANARLRSRAGATR